MDDTVRWILLRITFRTGWKLHMYVLYMKYEPTGYRYRVHVRKHKKSSLTRFCKLRIWIMYCRMCFYCKLWLLAITAVTHILVKPVVCSECVQISFFLFMVVWLCSTTCTWICTSALICTSDAKTTALILDIPLLELCTSTLIYICGSSGNFFSLINWCNSINVIIRILVLSVCVNCCFLYSKSVYIILSWKCNCEREINLNDFIVAELMCTQIDLFLKRKMVFCFLFLVWMWGVMCESVCALRSWVLGVSSVFETCVSFDSLRFH